MKTPLWVRQGYDDSYSHSRVVPYDRYETAKARHKRRLAESVNHQEIVRQWCKYRGVEFKAVGPQGCVWKFKRAPRGFARWIPSKAKLLHCGDWQLGITRRVKVFDYQQLIIELDARWL